jgi:acetyltransferase-like isoleucine patch superfamily enzyme
MNADPAIHDAGVGRRWHVRLAITQAVMGLFPSLTMNLLRRIALKACGIHIGRDTYFLGMPRLSGPGAIASRLHIGSRCGLNDGCEFDLSAPVTVGDRVAVGHEVRFMTTRTRDGITRAEPITVGDGVWLGARCTLMGGVTVGSGTVIGAGVTVTEDVPPDTLWTGAKPISLAKWR